MICDLKKQTNKSVVKFLRRQGQAAQIRSLHFKGIAPLFQENEVYVYSDDNEIVLVVVDALSFPNGELADEQPFEEEKPLYFTENSHRPSPVWHLAVTLELIRRRLQRFSKHIPHIYGVLLTGSLIINYDDMDDVWRTMEISVFHQMENLKKLSLPVSDTDDQKFDFPLTFIKAAEYDDWEVEDVEEKLEKLLDPDSTGLTQKEIAKKLGKSQEKTVEPQLFNFDEDDFDLDIPFPRETDDDEVLTMDRYKLGEKGNDVLKKITFVNVTLASATEDATPLYADSQVTVSFTAKAGEYFKLDQFKCYIYTPEFFPMCNSEEDGSAINRIKGSRLDVTIPCSRVWLPGRYILLVSGAPDDSMQGLALYEMTLDDRLTFEVSQQQMCRPCGLEDTLATCIENRFKSWHLIACMPGLVQLRRFAIKTRQIEVYNEFRSLMHGGKIGFSQNLLISTRNRDVDDKLLQGFAEALGYSKSFYCVDCAKLYDPSQPNPYNNVSYELDGVKERIICLTSIGILLCAGGKVIVRKIIDLMTEKSRANSLWICGTRQEIATLLNLYPTLDAFFLKDNRLEQEPYSAFEMVQAFFSQLAEESLECSPEVKDALSRAILREYQKGALSTWSLEDIRRFVCEEVRPRYLEHGLSNIEADQLPLLSVDDLCLDKLTSGTSTFEESMRDLNAMIGLDEIKQGIKTMANNARLFLERRRRGLKTSDDMVFHSIFTGNPGTGKTTVARMLGRIYHALGLLSKGDVIVADRTRLVGQYIGQTEDNMKVVLEEARGNVLFIDEAYTLYTGADDKKDFGMRVIESLLTVLSQPNPDMLVIFAGYTKEMDALLSTNPGLSSRFAYRYLFNDYTCEQLMLIARRLFERDEYILTDEAEAELKDCISQVLQQKQANFGNARWIEQFVKNGIIPAMADRIFTTGCDDFQRIEISDIRNAFEQFKPKATELKPTRHRVKGFSA
jgi:AAA+ superfamily predicted ATPase